MKEEKAVHPKQYVQGRHKLIVLMFGSKSHKIKDHQHMEDIKFYWKSLREEKHNEMAEWIKNKKKKKLII
jgi:hypothetical protein